MMRYRTLAGFWSWSPPKLISVCGVIIESNRDFDFDAKNRNSDKQSK
jgi:hypothetical protein